MSKDYTAKVFKSGNSVALRLPKALGLQEGEDMRLIAHADGRFTVYREQDAKRVFMSLYGAFSPGFMAGGRGDTEQEERNWGDSAREAAA